MGWDPFGRPLPTCRQLVRVPTTPPYREKRGIVDQRCFFFLDFRLPCSCSRRIFSLLFATWLALATARRARRLPSWIARTISESRRFSSLILSIASRKASLSLVFAAASSYPGSCMAITHPLLRHDSSGDFDATSLTPHSWPASGPCQADGAM